MGGGGGGDFLEIHNLDPSSYDLFVTINCRYIKNLMGISGLSVREDAVGNIFGRW